MRTAVLSALLAALSAAPALGQNAPRLELFGGYSYIRADVDEVDLRDVLRGVSGYRGAVTLGLGRYVGLQVDYSYHSKDFALGALHYDVTLHTLLAGFKIGPPASGAGVRPFLHLLAGVARRVDELSNPTGSISTDRDVFAAGVGGGVDLNATGHLGVRILADYTPTRFDEKTQHNYRVGAGIVIR